MPRSSRHKSHKQSKHSSREHSDSEDGVRKTKERSGKDESSTRAHGDSASGEKRKTSSQVREGRERKESAVHSNGEFSEDYVSSKRRKGKAEIFVDADRWNGGGDGKDSSDKAFEKELDKGNSVKHDEKLKDKSSKGENLKVEHKSKSKRNERGVPGDRIQESSAPVAVEKEEKNRSASKRKSDKDSSAYKDGRDSRDKDRRFDKERNGGHGSKSGDADVKVMDWDSGKKHAGNSGEERQSKRPRDNAEDILKHVQQYSEPEKEYEKRARRRREGSSEREKHPDDFKEGDERRVPVKADRPKDEKPRDEKYKDRGYAEKYPEDNHKSYRKKDENYLEESERDHRYYDEKYREDNEKYAKRQDQRHREEGDRDIRRKEDKHRDVGDRDTKRNDDKSREVPEDRRDDKYHEDAGRNSRRKNDRYREDGDKDIRRGDDRYLEDGNREDRHRTDGYRDGEREHKHKDEKYRDEAEKDFRHNSNPGDEIDRERRQKESKYDRDFRDRSGDRPDKRSGEDGYPADGHARKSSAYDESPNHDYRTVKYKDDESKGRANEKEERSTKEQASDSGKRSSKTDSASDRMRSAPRNADTGHSIHTKRRDSPSSSSHGLRDKYRSTKQDESKYRDYNLDDRPRDSLASTREHAGSFERSEKTASRSSEKLAPNDYSQPPESAERHLKSDLHSSPLQMSGGSRDRKGGRGTRESGLDAAEERAQADDDSLSISSPSVRNSHQSGSLRSLPPPPPFRSIESPVPMGSAEDDGRSKSHGHHRRMGEPSMGRMQGNVWRGVPTWPSPMPNGFMPFPHGPPPVGFHPVMQPFPTPPIFGVRPPMDLNLHSPYQIPDPERYFGPGRPMGWQNQVDDPMQSWDGSGAAYGDESRIYGRSDWDQSRNMVAGQAWESTDDAWKGRNRADSLETRSVGKDYNSPHGVDEASHRSSVDQHEDSTDIRHSTKITEKSNGVVPLDSVQDNDGLSEKGKTETAPLCKAYLCRLDISAELADPELFSKFSNLISMEQVIVSDSDVSKILYVENVESKMSSISSPSNGLLPAIDDSVFQKSISLYKKQTQQTVQPKDGAGFEASIEPKTNLNDADIKAENLCHGLPDGVPNSFSESDPNRSSPKAVPTHHTFDECVADVTVTTEEPVSTLADETPKDKDAEMQNSSPTELYSDETPKDNDVEMQHSPPISTSEGCAPASDETATPMDSDIKQQPSSPITTSDGCAPASDETPKDDDVTILISDGCTASTDETLKDDDIKKQPDPLIITAEGCFAASDETSPEVCFSESAPHAADETMAGSEENKEVMLYGALLNSDTVSEQNMHEVVGLSRIHHSH